MSYNSMQSLDANLNVQMVESMEDAAVRHLYLSRIGEPNFGDAQHLANHKEASMCSSACQKLLANEKSARESFIFRVEEDDGRETLHQVRFLPGSATMPAKLYDLGRAYVAPSPRLRGPFAYSLEHLRGAEAIDSRGMAAATTLGDNNLGLCHFLPAKLIAGGSVSAAPTNLREVQRSFFIG